MRVQRERAVGRVVAVLQEALVSKFCLVCMVDIRLQGRPLAPGKHEYISCYTKRPLCSKCGATAAYGHHGLANGCFLQKRVGFSHGLCTTCGTGSAALCGGVVLHEAGSFGTNCTFELLRHAALHLLWDSLKPGGQGWVVKRFSQLEGFLPPAAPGPAETNPNRCHRFRDWWEQWASRPFCGCGLSGAAAAVACFLASTDATGGSAWRDFKAAFTKRLP